MRRMNPGIFARKSDLGAHTGVFIRKALEKIFDEIAWISKI
jgi:hypothetical protein